MEAVKSGTGLMRRSILVPVGRTVAMIVEEGMIQAHVARRLGVESKRLSLWRKQVAERKTAAAFPGNGNARDAELAWLQRELATVRRESDVLIKTAIIFAEVPRR